MPDFKSTGFYLDDETNDRIAKLAEANFPSTRGGNKSMLITHLVKIAWQRADLFYLEKPTESETDATQT